MSSTENSEFAVPEVVADEKEVSKEIKGTKRPADEKITDAKKAKKEENGAAPEDEEDADGEDEEIDGEDEEEYDLPYGEEEDLDGEDDDEDEIGAEEGEDDEDEA